MAPGILRASSVLTSQPMDGAMYLLLGVILGIVLMVVAIIVWVTWEGRTE
jgi:hypothetical protein